jgi:PHP family Zn ribbon phosphoesterase
MINQIPTNAEKIRQNALKSSKSPFYKYSKVCPKCLERYDTDYKRSRACLKCDGNINSKVRQRLLKRHE